MDARCDVSFKQLSDEANGLVNAVVADCFVVVLERCEGVHDVGGHLQFRQFDDLTQRIVRLDGHHTGKDGHSDAQLATVAHKRDERVRREKELSNDEISTSVHLFFKATQIVFV